MQQQQQSGGQSQGYNYPEPEEFKNDKLSINNFTPMPLPYNYNPKGNMARSTMINNPVQYTNYNPVAPKAPSNLDSIFKNDSGWNKIDLGELNSIPGLDSGGPSKYDYPD